MAFPEHGRLKPGSLGFLLTPLVAVLVGVQAGTSDRRVERPVRMLLASPRSGQYCRFGTAARRSGFPPPVRARNALVIVSVAESGVRPVCRSGWRLNTRRVRDDSGAGCRRHPAPPGASRPFRPASRARPRAASLPPQPGLPHDGARRRRRESRAITWRSGASFGRWASGSRCTSRPRTWRRWTGSSWKTWSRRSTTGSYRSPRGPSVWPHDVDGDGRFTVLLSSWLGRLGDGRHAVDGFVRVTDLDPLYSPPFGNRCDMMYLSTGLRPGPHLRTVLAHEYMHAVVFSQQVATRPAGAVRRRRGGRLARRGARPPGRGPARLLAVEPRLPRQRVPLAARAISAGGRGLLRGRPVPQPRQPGGDLPVPAVVRRPVRAGAACRPRRVRLQGIANLEQATGCSFADLYRRWSVALFESGLDPSRAGSATGDAGYRSVGHADARSMTGSSPARGRTRVVVGRARRRWDAAGTSSHFVVVRSGRRGRSR